MPVSTIQDFSWLPTSKSCGCLDTRLNCLDRKDTSRLGSTVLNVQRRQVWKESHPARFVPELPAKYIRLFSHAGQTVLDPFCGSGTTNVMAMQLGRNSIGIDVNPRSIALTLKRLRDEIHEASSVTRHLAIQGDCRKLLMEMPSGGVDLVVTSPPYFDVVDYDHDDPRQLGNIHDYDRFLRGMEEAFEGMWHALKEGGHAIINTQDLYKKEVKCPIHSDYLQMAKEVGFAIMNVNIYILNYSTGGRLVYGYPVSYYPKNDHEYILILKKE
jgi:DNA modification methylase